MVDRHPQPIIMMLERMVAMLKKEGVMVEQIHNATIETTAATMNFGVDESGFVVSETTGHVHIQINMAFDYYDPELDRLAETMGKLDSIRFPFNCWTSGKRSP